MLVGKVLKEEIKPAQCCIKLGVLFDLYYDARKHKIKKPKF